MIDARGQSCPIPVVMVQDAVKKGGNPAELQVKVDAMVCVENMRSLQYRRPATDKSLAAAELRDGQDTISWQPNLGFPFPNDDLGNYNQVRHFIDCVQGKEKPLLTFADTVKTMRLMDSVMALARGLETT